MDHSKDPPCLSGPRLSQSLSDSKYPWSKTKTPTIDQYIQLALLLSHRHSERPKGAQRLKGVEESPVGVTLAIASRDSSTRYARY